MYMYKLYIHGGVYFVSEKAGPLNIPSPMRAFPAHPAQTYRSQRPQMSPSEFKWARVSLCHFSVCYDFLFFLTSSVHCARSWSPCGQAVDVIFFLLIPLLLLFRSPLGPLFLSNNSEGYWTEKMVPFGVHFGAFR